MEIVLEIILILAALIGAGACVAGLVKLGRAEKKRREREIREGYPWDWTAEDERKVEAMMELICDKCKDNDRLNQNETLEACAMCAVRDVLYRITCSRCDR